ncbi:MAG: RtcB family protein [Thaumarchaeota archaeon]|nr:RtcB family protein [Nitrososphaerota archaeon]
MEYRIEADSTRGMKVPVTIYADEGLLQKMMTDRTITQAINVSTLPGVVKHVVVLPDGHEGYGFPVGGVAAMDAEEGMISPGGVGYDINCLHPSTRVYTEDRNWKKITEISDNDTTLSFDVPSKSTITTGPILFLKKKQNDTILKITTKFGRELLVTKDHPLLTDIGMVDAGLVSIGTRLVSHGFEGLEHLEPAEDVIYNVEDLNKAMDELGISDRGNARAQVLKHLVSLGLDELKTTSNKLSRMLKLLGIILSDGTVPKGSKYVSIYGRLEDLKSVETDLNWLGINSIIISRQRCHKINSHYGEATFQTVEHSINISSRGFRVILHAMGIPAGNRSAQRYRIPQWIKSLKAWQKRLFVAAYFGGELTKPISNNGYNFTMPTFSVSKLETLLDNAFEIVNDIKEILDSLGVKTSEPALVDGYTYDGKKGTTKAVRLGIESNADNMLRFLGTVGYVYNKEKEMLASIASLYLSFTSQIRVQRDNARNTAREMYSSGKNSGQILVALKGEYFTQSFIEHSIWSERKSARVWDVMRFNEFMHKVSIGDGYAWDQITGMEETDYDGYVYDLTINDRNHNFIANGIVVSNCGVRLVRTNLNEKDVRPKLKELVLELFKSIPSGVGSKGAVRLSSSDLDEVLVRGVQWAVDHGYGSNDDADVCEENGQIKNADPSRVSQTARKRGSPQLGSLGSGNHFLEIQRVDQIHDKEAAKRMGIFNEGQITVLIHCGSRGFGHQVCSDYLRTSEQALQKYKINLVDRELACVPNSSEEGESYRKAMFAALNFAWSNRQMITHWTRKAFERIFKQTESDLDMKLIYDVAHNIAKVEKHKVDGELRSVVVHRKGATRAFPKGRDEIPQKYRDLGQPVFIPGSMGTGSWILLGQPGSMDLSFGSTAHGAGRMMSRSAARRNFTESQVQKSLGDKGIFIKALTREGVVEETPEAYKDVDAVANVSHEMGIATKVAKLVPIGVIKG